MARYKLVTQKMSFDSLPEDACSILTELQEEMEEWASNMEDGNLASTEKCATVRETADNLANCQDAPRLDGTVAKKYEDLEVEVLQTIPGNKRVNPSRSVRRDNAVQMLRTAQETAQEKIDTDTSLTEEEKEDLESYIEELETIIDEAEGAEFPGMYG